MFNVIMENEEKAFLIKTINEHIEGPYKPSVEDIIRLEGIQNRIINMVNSYPEKVSKLKGKELDQFQIEHFFKLYSEQYECEKLKERVLYKSNHCERLKIVKKMIGVDWTNKEEYQGVLNEFILSLKKEIKSEIDISLAIAKVAPHLDKSLNEYVELLYNEMLSQKVSFELKPQMDKLKSDFSEKLLEIQEEQKQIDTNKPNYEELLEAINTKKRMLKSTFENTNNKINKEFFQRLQDLTKEKVVVDSYDKREEKLEEIKRMCDKLIIEEKDNTDSLKKVESKRNTLEKVSKYSKMYTTGELLRLKERKFSLENIKKHFEINIEKEENFPGIHFVNIEDLIVDDPFIIIDKLMNKQNNLVTEQERKRA
ncbi:MAG: hypothetical protein PHQ64_02140 [Bacilli bacterium]|nr:hypothetical protein [Bacilli bacterium]